MTRPLSLHHLVAPEISAVELVEIAATLGCDHVCLFTQDPQAGIAFPVVDDAQADGVCRAMARTGVSAYGVASFALSPTTRVELYEPALARGAMLGAARANVRLLDADDARVTANFAAFAALAARHGISAGIEFMGFGDADALPRALRVVAAAGVGSISVDALHLVRTGATIAMLRAMDPALIGYVQLCDGPLTATAADYPIEGAVDRLAPGEGAFPLRDILALLPAHQPVSLEVPTASLRARGMGALERARHVVDATRRLLAAG